MSYILVVEDDAQIRELWGLYLRGMGHRVDFAENGLEALYYAREHTPDLVILDLMMPMASGDLVLGFFRSTDSLKQVPVLVVSAHHNVAGLAEQYEADGFLKKPVLVDDFRAAVTALLSEE